MDPPHPADAALTSVRLCTLCMNRDDGPHYVGTLGDEAECSRCGAPAGSHVLLPIANEPHLVGWGASQWASTSVGLVVAQPFRWDTNGWYARLGVEPTATKREIRDAYLLLQDGADDLLQEAFKGLIDPESRWAYDRRPLGQPVNDSVLYEALLRESTQMISDAIAEGREIPEPLRRLMQQIEDEAEAEAGVDDVTPAVHDAPWPFAFYTWQSGNRDRDTMQEWQVLLLQAVSEHKEVFRLAVGFAGGRMERLWEVKVIGNLVVAFLSDTERPNAAIARACAAELVQVQGTGRAAHQTQECAYR